MKTIFKLHKYFDCTSRAYNEALIIECGTFKNGSTELGIELPTSPQWCSTCRGTGKRSEWDVKGYDIDMMLEDDEDGSMREAYFGGKTDVPCDCCHYGVITVVNYDGLSDDEKVIMSIDADAYREEAEYYAVSAAERRMGA